MSPLETVMVLALGSALTFVFFMLFGRVFWNMAVNAGARRNAKQVPVQVLDLQADRDRLRAEHAMMARKLELRLDDMKTRMTEQMAEVSRNRNRMQTILQDLGEKEDLLKERETEINKLETQLKARTAELEATAQTAENLAAEVKRKDQELLDLQQASNQLTSTLADKINMLDSLNQELRSEPSLEVELESETENRLRRRVAQLTTISSEISRETEQLPEVEKTGVVKNMATATPEPKPGAANVISLAQRIRALQSGMNE